MIPQLPQGWPSVMAAVAILAVVAWGAGWVATRILHRVISGVTSRTRSTWDDRLIERGVFRRLAGVGAGGRGLPRNRARLELALRT